MVATFLSKGSLPPKMLNTIIAFVIVGMPTRIDFNAARLQVQHL